MRLGVFLLLSIVLPAACLARESVCLTSGFCMVADSHTQANGMYVLRVGSGTIEYRAEEIRVIEALPEDVAPLVSMQPVTTQVQPQAVLNAAAQHEGVDEIFMRSVAKVESGLRQDAVSKKGALGLMQLMPETAAELGVDPKRADQNATGGARYLRTLLEQYHYNPVLTLAAYNAGPGAVAKYRGIPPYYETRAYVVRVLKEYERQLRAAGIRTDSIGAQASAKSPSAIN